jgi:hypothetical protein
MASTTTARPKYERFTVLLDDPAEMPRLGFDVYADAFAQIIERSRPRFAIGIFGDWGSGKTTLMRAIEARVADKPRAILPVWFNAWRYEREEHLIVPLLDHLREALLDWQEKHAPQSVRGRAGAAASLFGRASRRLLRGLTISGGVPGLEASLAFDQVIDPPTPEAGPASFYHAAFRDMREATEAFVPETGHRRIVVFVDDLDRCLPTNALQVLESMKLFFDLEGFIFVVGLDQSVIERAIEAKYEAGHPDRPAPVVIERAAAEGGNGDRPETASSRIAGEPGVAPIAGADYVKKIFQVPFALPRIGTTELNGLVNALCAGPDIPKAQADDLMNVVRPHLGYLSDRDSFNPREVKRLINAYTLQMKLLYPRLTSKTDPHTVLAVQLMGFRPDWAGLYDVLRGDPAAFLRDLQQAVTQPAAEPVVIGDEAEPVPAVFMAYVRTVAAPMLEQRSLVPYVSSAEQTRPTDLGALEARQALRELRRLFQLAIDGGRVDTGILTPIHTVRESLVRARRSAPDIYSGIEERLYALEGEYKAVSGKPELAQSVARSFGERCLEITRTISDLLLELRRRADLDVI